MSKEELLSSESTDTIEESNHKLVIHNDEHNTFDWVIECITDVLDYSLTQAEQITILVHFKGKAIAKHGSFDTLSPFKQGLLDRGLSVTIED